MGHDPARLRLRGPLSTVVCALVAVSLAGGLAGTTANAAPRAGAPPASDTPTTDPVAVAERAAVAQARRTGVPVPVPEATTETDTVTAKPDGTLVLKRTVEPSRTRKSGTWRDLDPTLAPAADGTIRPAGTTSDLALGGSGSRLLASMTNNGRRLAFTWPTALPKPVLAGDGALYPGVLPDVDLKVTAGEQGGFSHTLVVKTPEAAKNPQLATLRLGMTTDGVSVAENADGTLAARTPDGKIAFSAPTPAMWDSRTTPKTGGGKLAAATTGDPVPADQLASNDRRPGVHAATAPLETAVGPGALTLTPDPGLLNAPDTVFPLYIDPAWVPMLDRASMYGWAQQAYPDTPGYGRTDYQPGAGYQRWRAKTGLERTYYRVDYNWKGRLDGKAIKKVVFNTTQVDSAMDGCGPELAQPVYLYLTSDTLTTGTNWINKPTEKGLWGTASVPSSSVDHKCGNRLVDFDITDKILPFPNWEFLTLGVYGKESPESTTNNGFKRFSRNAADNYIYIEYNSRPNTPTNLRMTPEPVNGAASGNCGYIGAVNPTVGGVSLYADLSDPDGHTVGAKFNIDEVGNGNPLVYDSGWISWGASGHQARADVPAGKLLDGHTYKWSVVADDTDLGSGWIDGCTFTVDATPPTVPTVTSTDFPVAGGRNHARDKGTFVFAATDNASGVDGVEYSLNGTIPVGGATRATWDELDKKWKAKDVLVLNWGSNTLYAQTVDKAGNRSQPTIYTFYAPSDPNATTKLGDITGDLKVDLLVTDDTGALRMYGTDTDPTTGGVVASNADEGPLPNGDTYTWAGAKTTHRGGTGVSTDDLYAHAAGQLYLYRSGGADAGNQYFTSARQDPVARPGTCVDPARGNGACVGYNNRDWTHVTQILAPGDVDHDGRLDLLTLEDDGGGTRRLWLFHGAANPASFTKATLLGTTGWNNLDLIAPGDNTGDQVPDLWARDRTTGQLFQYASRAKADGTPGDVTALGDTATRTVIGTGLGTLLYPKLNSDGDLDGDDKADLWAQGADGRLHVALAVTPGPDGNRFGPMHLIADNQTPWTTCEKYPSAGNTNIQLDICGPILAKYKASGGPGGPLKLPIGATSVDPDNTGRYANFQGNSGSSATGASIHWSPVTGAWSVTGNIRDKWLGKGGTRGVLGYPVSDENPVKDGADKPIGAISMFAGGPGIGAGAITWTPTLGAYEIHGAIHNRWQAMSGPRGVLGFPATDILPTAPQKPGFFAHFRIPGASGDTGSIYQSTTTGAWPVWGSIRGTWAAQGWETGPLGFPTSAEYGVMAGASSNFEGGHVRWNMHTGGTTVYPGVDETPMGRTMLSGDFDGDGRSDVATVVDFGECATGWFTQLRRADGSLGEPRQSHVQPAGTFCQGDAKYAAGDFDGDGRADIAALYHYGNGHVRVFTFLANTGGDGGFRPGGAGWEHPAGWDFDRTTLLAGDTTGDKRADLVLVQGYADGRISTHSLPAATGGVFATLVNGWVETTPDWWRYQNARYTLGDLNGDGRADLGAVYVHDNGDAKAFGFITRADGTIPAPGASWNAPGAGWNITGIQAVAADTNGDKHADIVLMFDEGGAATTLRTLLAKTDGTLNAPFAGWNSGPGNWEAPRAAPLAGDVNGDGRADITAVYDYGTTRWAAYTFTAKTDGGLNTHTKSWEAAAGIW